MLDFRYQVERFNGGGSFGLVYEAKHANLGSRCAIKELFPQDLVVREDAAVRLSSESHAEAYKVTLKNFRKEGRRLIKLDACEHIVRCLNCFGENNTGYLVMDYVEGKSLESKVESCKEKGYSFSRKEIAELPKDLCADLKKIHGLGIFHLDIKPDNIRIMTEDNKPVLLDFGTARNIAGSHTENKSLIGTRPYASSEQEESKGKLGPWLDIYAIGIMLYKLIFLDDAKKLPDSSDRIGELYESEGNSLRLAAKEEAWV